MAKNPEALNFSKNYLEPEVTTELKNFFENKFNSSNIILLIKGKSNKE